MIVKVPSFYEDFQCKASECSDNCCIGWEIDIDDDAMQKYKTIGGEFGKRLLDNIEADDYPHFNLTHSERCPFLNSNNLCDIILNIGEENICEICREHPRFHSWYGDYKESGLGLCCEEAVRLLLNCESLEFKTVETDEDTDDFEFDHEVFNASYNLREQIFDIFKLDNLNIFQKLTAITEICAEACGLNEGNALPEIDFVIRLAKAMEPIDNIWTSAIDKIQNSRDIISSRFSSTDSDEDNKYSKISSYLIFRYLLNNAVYENDIMQTVFFVCFFITLLRCADIVFPNQPIENIKLLSKQLEYSDENMNAVYNAEKG